MKDFDPLKACCPSVKVIGIIGLVLSIITLLFLLIVFALIILIKGKQINEMLLYVIIGEGLNNIIKIVFFCVKNKLENEKLLYVYIVFFIQIASDYLSLFANVLLSLMVFFLVKQKKAYKSPKYLCFMRFLLFFSIIFFTLILFFINNVIEKKQIKEEELHGYEDCNNWVTLLRTSDIIGIVLIWISIIIIVLVNTKTICYLKAKKKQLDSVKVSITKDNEETSISEKTPKSEESGLSKKIAKISCNLLSFPIATVVLWLPITSDKIINRIIISKYDSNYTPCEDGPKIFIIFKRVLIIINLLFYNGKGLLYSYFFIKFQPAILMKLKELWEKLKKKNKEEEKDGLEKKGENLVGD